MFSFGKGDDRKDSGGWITNDHIEKRSEMGFGKKSYFLKAE